MNIEANKSVESSARRKIDCQIQNRKHLSLRFESRFLCKALFLVSSTFGCPTKLRVTRKAGPHDLRPLFAGFASANRTCASVCVCFARKLILELRLLGPANSATLSEQLTSDCTSKRRRIKQTKATGNANESDMRFLLDRRFEIENLKRICISKLEF